MAGAEEGFEIFFCHMHVTGGGFNQNLLHERVTPSFDNNGFPGPPGLLPERDSAEPASYPTIYYMTRRDEKSSLTSINRFDIL